MTCTCDLDCYRSRMQSKYPYDAVLFDLDGVVVDTNALHSHVWDRFARRHGYFPTEAELLATHGRRAGETIRIWFGSKLTEQEIAALSSEREMHFNQLMALEPIVPVRGVGEFLAALKTRNIPRAVVTSAIPANAHQSLEKVGLKIHSTRLSQRLM
jgi:beta-phosphoglucomutase